MSLEYFSTYSTTSHYCLLSLFAIFANSAASGTFWLCRGCSSSDLFSAARGKFNNLCWYAPFAHASFSLCNVFTGRHSVQTTPPSKAAYTTTLPAWTGPPVVPGQGLHQLINLTLISEHRGTLRSLGIHWHWQRMAAAKLWYSIHLGPLGLGNFFWMPSWTFLLICWVTAPKVSPSVYRLPGQ